MTVKAKRAKSLRIMEYEEACSYGMGGWVDESFSSVSVRTLLSDATEPADILRFEAFFGPRLGRYRSMSDAHSDQPSIAQEMELLDEACTAIDQVRIRLANLPPDASAYINDVSWKRRKEIFHAFQQRLDNDLKEAWSLLTLTERELEKYKGKPGRKPSSLRDRFLHDVAKYIGTFSPPVGKEQAAGIASSILRSVGVDAPDDPREARKLVRGIGFTAGENPS